MEWIISNVHTAYGGDTGIHLYLSVLALYESRFITLTLIKLSILLVYSRLISNRYVRLSLSLIYLTKRHNKCIYSCHFSDTRCGFSAICSLFALIAPFHYVLHPRKHRFTWFLRQNPTKNYFAISWLRLIQLFFLLHRGSSVSTRSNTRSTRCTHGPLIGLNEIAKRHWCLVFSVRAGYSNPIRATHSQLSRDQVAVTWVSRVL